MLGNGLAQKQSGVKNLDAIAVFLESVWSHRVKYRIIQRLAIRERRGHQMFAGRLLASNFTRKPLTFIS